MRGTIASVTLPTPAHRDRDRVGTLIVTAITAASPAPWSSQREVLPRLLGSERRELYPWEIYRWSCGACRIFGHARLKGRISFTDLAPVGEVRTETRYGVTISRLSQAVAIGPFETEAVVEGTFAGQIVMENFELWQVGLIALALRAIDAGLVKIGFGKNRGFGEVSLVVTEARLDEVPSGLSANVWRGIGSLAKASALGAYGLQPSDRLAGLPNPKAVEEGIPYVRSTYDAAADSIHILMEPFIQVSSAWLREAMLAEVSLCHLALHIIPVFTDRFRISPRRSAAGVSVVV